MSTSASHLVRLGHKPKPSTVTFDVSEDDADMVGGSRVYTFPMPPRSALDVRFDVGSFSTQSVEPNVTAEENKVRWTEGIALTTGERPTILSNAGSSNGVPVFSHEIAIVEGDSLTCFKVGVPPRLNEISIYTASVSGTTITKEGAASLTDTVSLSDHWFVTAVNGVTTQHTYPYAAPHYGKPMQEFVAAGNAPGMKFELVNVTSTAHVDCLDTAAVDFQSITNTSTTTTEDAVHNSASTAFQIVDSNLLTGGNPTGVTYESVAFGHLSCSDWFVSDLVDFLNFQLRTVKDSQLDQSSASNTAAKINGCTTTNTSPTNTYRFEQVGGRVQLVRTAGSASFAVKWNTHAAGNYAYHSVQDPTGVGTDTTKSAAVADLAVCPTGHAARSTSNLWSALGFSQTTPGAFTRDVSVDLKGTRRTTSAYGFRAAADHAGVFETAIDPAHYTAQTFADAVGAAMNMDRNVGTVASPNAPTAAFTFVDSTRATRTAVLSTGHRTPHQLAEAVGFLLNRLDARGVYAQTQENLTIHDGDARLTRQQRVGDVAEAARLLWYRVVYDKETKKFTIENREIESYAFSAYDASDAFAYPPNGVDGEALSTTAGIPIVQYPATTTRAPFSISFRSADLQVGSAQLGTTPSTAVAARLLGFVPERVYGGTQVVSDGEVRDASYATLLTKCLTNDANLTATYPNASQRPLGSAGEHGGHFYHNQVHFRGSGPDARVYPRYAYAVNGSQYNDKAYTISARHPPVASSAAINPVRDPATGHVYSNDLVVDATQTVLSTGDVLTAAGPNSGNEGTQYKTNALVVVDDADSTGSAIAAVSAAADGAVSTLAVLHQGDGTNFMDATEGAMQVNADGPLRIVDGRHSSNAFNSTVNEGKDASRIIVQSAHAVEFFGSYRSTQGCLPFQVGDVVELGANACVLLGSANLGASVQGHLFNIQRVTAGGTILTGATIITANGTNHDDIKEGHRFRVLQGDCMTVIQATQSITSSGGETSYSFKYVTKGTGHYVDAAVQLFGPIPYVLTGYVEEVMQVSFRHESDEVPDLESAFGMRKTYRDPANAAASFTSASYARDGSLIKIRLAHKHEYYAAGSNPSHPSNLAYIRPLHPVRFQVLNHAPAVETHFRKTDTVWHMFGFDDDSAVGASLKAGREWDLSAGSGITLTLENDVGVPQVHDYVVRGQVTHKVLAKVDYSTALSRTWGVVHAREYAGRNLKEIKIRILDRFLRDYDFKGRSFTIAFNLHSF